METNTINKTVEETAFQKPVRPAARPARSGRNFLKRFIVILAISLVIVLGLYFISKYSRFDVLGLDGGNGNNNWQAVFLTNGQVYFGRVVKENNKTVVLREIYYLQVTQPLQTSGDQQPTPAQNELSLVKLGNELHGPKDEMRINAAHVLFIEDLKADSQVVEAITNYKQSQ